MIKYLKNAEEFESLIKGNCLVDFYADWCGPCKMMNPVLEEIDDIDIIKVNIDEFSNISNKYGIMSIPTLIYFEDGKEVQKEIGFRNKDEIYKMIKKQ